MKKSLISIFFCFGVLISISQETLDYFLPDNVTYDQKIPTPEQFFNQQVGEWHLTHDQILFYMKEIARVSDRAILYE